MPEPIWLLVIGLALVLGVGLRRASLARLARTRLATSDHPPAEAPNPIGAGGVRGGHWMIAAGLGAALAVLLAFGSSIDRQLAVALGFLVVCLAASVLSGRAADRALRIDSQLADALDLVVSALRSGTTIIDALESAADELRPPVGDVLAEAAARLRLGEATEIVMRDVEAELPVESTRLFAQALIVQSQTGSALVPALAAVARSARDRIELARRVRAQTSEVRFSVIAVLLVTYAIAWLSWSTAPERVSGFLASALGGSLAAICVAMQGAGVLWMERLSRIDV